MVSFYLRTSCRFTIKSNGVFCELRMNVVLFANLFAFYKADRTELVMKGREALRETLSFRRNCAKNKERLRFRQLQSDVLAYHTGSEMYTD